MTIRVKDFIPLTTLIIISYTFVSLYFLRSLSTNTGDFLRYAILDFYGDRISSNTLIETNNIFGFLKQLINEPSIIGLKLIDFVVIHHSTAEDIKPRNFPFYETLFTNWKLTGG